jgi:negative regulator of flagellin synthesis FlgM
MSNDIDGISRQALGKISETTASRKVSADNERGAASTGGSQERPDTVELTSAARLLEKLESQLAGAADVDTGRIEQMKAAIADGTYRIDDREIADALLRSDRELGRGK